MLNQANCSCNTGVNSSLTLPLFILLWKTTWKKNNIQIENPQRELFLVDELHQSKVSIFFHKVAIVLLSVLSKGRQNCRKEHLLPRVKSVRQQLSVSFQLSYHITSKHNMLKKIMDKKASWCYSDWTHISFEKTWGLRKKWGVKCPKLSNLQTQMVLPLIVCLLGHRNHGRSSR